MRFFTTVFFLFFIFLSASLLEAQTVRPVPYYPMNNWDTSPYKSYRFTRAGGTWDWINFRLLFPANYDSTAQDGKKYPIIIMLHGAGESGRMMWNNSTKTNSPYPSDDVRRDNNDHQLMFGGKEHLRAVESGRFPGFVLFPQNSYGTWVNGKGDASSEFHQDLGKAVSLIEHLVKNLKIDPSRIYVHGLSAGGLGTWLAAYRRPDLFAAALPMSAPGDPAMAEQLAEVPLWVFQGELDTNPRPWATRQTTDAVLAAGGEVRYTEYAGVGHNTWNRAYGEKDFFEWMLAHKKSSGTTPNLAPVVEAGENKNITLPVSTASFTAVASDPDGSIASYSWTKTAGPEVTLSGAGTATLSLSGLVQGTYTFLISVTDNKNAIATDEVTLVVNPAANKPPVVNAGEDKEITLPDKAATFTATASDPDGTIASYLWEEINGREVTMTGINSKTLSVSVSEQGIYTFKVTVTDNKGAKISDQVVLTVQPAPNVKPVVNAGNDKEITLPVNSLKLTAEAGDSDGNLAAYKWEKISGPDASISGATTPELSLTKLTAGDYVFRITVTDNEGATANDQVGVKVNPAPNKPPVVNAGTDKAITLPENTTFLIATASDPEGGNLTYLWEKVSGPAATLSGASTAQLTLTKLAEGAYVFRVTVTDPAGATATDEVGLKVNPAPNKPPVVNAGEDKTITLPANAVTFTAAATDPEGKTLTYKWEKISGPSASLAGASAASLSLSALTEGAYVFKVTVTDPAGATATDEVGLKVNPLPNKAPVVSAGADKSITLPLNSVTITATATDPEEKPLGYKWEKMSGPAAGLAGVSTASLTASDLQEGSYVFKITVTDHAGATATDEVGVKVNPVPNKAPLVNAGEDKTITLPVNTASLTATASDPEGKALSFLWERLNGPATTLAGVNTKTLSLSGLTEGSYTFKITATDPEGATATDQVVLNVNPASNKAPVVNAGADKTITLPVNGTTFTATASDPDGTIKTYSWEKTEGPEISMSGKSAAELVLNGLTAGTYTFRISVTDNSGATATDEVGLRVLPAPNKPPLVNAGADKTIMLPAGTTTFTATASDPEGKTFGYKWEKISGPAASLSGVSTGSLSVSGFTEGSYVFRVTVTDDAGATATDEVGLKVNPAPNNPPVVNAGNDQTITLPVSSATFTATATDPEGKALSYKWEKISGPAANLNGTSAASLFLTGLAEGSYVFKVTVTDLAGATATDEVGLRVNPAVNKPPLVNAGADKTVTLPVVSVVFTATASDPEEKPLSYLWTQVNGPAVTITGASTATLSLSALNPGTYTFRVLVTDSQGAMASDEVVLVVNPAPNKMPVVNAGEDKIIELPESTTSFTASASDPDGSVASYLWQKESGPAAILSGSTTPTVSLSGLKEGNYVFSVAVTDNRGAVVKDQVSLQVKKAPNQEPTVNAGEDYTIILPENTASLYAEATDPDGAISEYVWEKVSGPALTLRGESTETLVLSGLTEGSYVLRITVSDNRGGTATDEVKVIVKPAANRLPVVEAGEKVNLSLPVNAVSLTATASDPDGRIATWLWEKVSGPEAATLNDQDKAVLKVSGLEQGSYTFRVTITDDKGGFASDEVIVSVFEETAGNQPPLANAGSDTTVVLPLDYLGLRGSGSDNDGSVVSYLWEKVSGPEVDMGYADSSYMELAGLVKGEYVLRLTVTDDAGATAWDEMTLTVSDTPVVSAIDPDDIGFVSLLAYPNPFESTINLKLEFSRQETLIVRVFDPLSKTLYRGSIGTVPGKEVVYTFEPVAGKTNQGIYFIEVRSMDGSFSKMIRMMKR